MGVILEQIKQTKWTKQTKQTKWNNGKAEEKVNEEGMEVEEE